MSDFRKDGGWCGFSGLAKVFGCDSSPFPEGPPKWLNPPFGLRITRPSAIFRPFVRQPDYPQRPTAPKELALGRVAIVMVPFMSWKTLLNGLGVFALAVQVGCNSMTSQALNSEGVRLYQSGNYQQAAVTFQKAIASNPKSASAYYNLASSLHKNGKLHNRPADLQQAERLYNQCLDYDPNHAECYRGLAVLLTETNRQDAAVRLLEGWASRSPQNPNPRIELARVLEESNNLSLAAVKLEEAITIDPQNSRALTALGRLRESTGDPQQALANYQRSLTINRFQPAIEARVASLQARQSVAAPGATPPSGTRTVQQWQSTVRY